MLKKIISVVFVVFCAIDSISQVNIAMTWAKATNADSCFRGKYFFLNPEFRKLPWAETILKKVGQEEFERILKFSGDPDYPPGKMQYFDPTQMSRRDTRTYAKNLAELNMFKIATFEDERGANAILRVPYLENKSWDSASKWDTVYFIVQDKFISESPMCQITSWDNCVNVVPTDFWERNVSSIVQQVGLPEFMSIKKSTSIQNIPKELLLNKEGSRKRDKQLHNKLLQLKGFKIATFNDDKEGKLAIFRASCYDNEVLDRKSKWEVLYFLVPDRDPTVFRFDIGFQTARN